MPAAMKEAIGTIRFDEIDSTSAFLRRETGAGHLVGPTLVVAATQTDGVGRWSRRWLSPRGGLWMSLAVPLPPEAGRSRLRGLGLRLGVAVYEGVCAVLVNAERERLRMKWPNDVVVVGGGTGEGKVEVDRRKLGGLLVETALPAATPRLMWMIIGVGVNANFDEPELPIGSTVARATSIRSAFGREVDLDVLCESLCERLLDRAMEEGLSSEVVATFERSLVGMGERARFTLADGRIIDGVLESIDSQDGLALVRTGSGTLVRCEPQSISA